MKTLGQTLKRKKVDCLVELPSGSAEWYMGLPCDLLKEIPPEDLNRKVKDEYCAGNGLNRQWTIWVE